MINANRKITLDVKKVSTSGTLNIDKFAIKLDIPLVIRTLALAATIGPRCNTWPGNINKGSKFYISLCSKKKKKKKNDDKLAAVM